MKGDIKERMKAEQIIEVIDKLVGEITPIGETNYDTKVKENLNIMTEIVGHYVDDICEIAQTDSYMASIQECQKIAKDFVKGLRDAYESLDDMVQRENNMVKYEIAINTLDAMKKQFLGETRDILDTAIQALEEIQAYREIGTVEEFKTLKEKEEQRQKWKRRIIVCPICGYKNVDKLPDICPRCGTINKTN